MASATSATSAARAGVARRAGAGAASLSTTSMMRAFSAGGGVRGSAEAGSASTATCSDVGVLAAERALVEVALEAGGLVLGQRAEQPRAERVGPLIVIARVRAHVDGISSIRRLLRSFSRPSRILPFTVPTGAPRISAISVWVKPPK